MKQNHEDLIALPVDEAVTLKFERGIAQYRSADEDFVGDPLRELHDECLDAFAYALVAQMNGVDVDEVLAYLYWALIETRALIHPSKPPHSIDCT